MRRLRKKYKRPRSPWNMQQIIEQKALRSQYGLRTNKEILIARYMLRGYRRRARELIAIANEQEKALLVGKLNRLGIMQGQALDDVLALTLNSVLDRRLQTIVFKNGMATSIKHARQLITHGKIAINGRKMKYPSYIVRADEEGSIAWYGKEPKIVRPAKPAEAKGAEAKEAAVETDDKEEGANVNGEPESAQD
jgi:small subunit ribosomal protein S4